MLPLFSVPLARYCIFYTATIFYTAVGLILQLVWCYLFMPLLVCCSSFGPSSLDCCETLAARYAAVGVEAAVYP